METTPNQAPSSLALHEIVAVAAYLAGADSRHVDTEDIAYKANEIAPGCFTWRKYKDQIKLDAIYKHLWDLTKPDKGEYIKGSEKKGWLLTVAGTAFAEHAVSRVKSHRPVRERRSRTEEAWLQRERSRMLGEGAFLKVSSGRAEEVTVADAERFFRLDDYVIGAARARKIQQAENAFHNDAQLGPAISKIASLVRGTK